MRPLLIIFLGGGLGSVLRYLVNRWVTGLIASVFPYGTFLVNITACFLIGFLVFFSDRLGAGSLNWRLFLITGLCGGYSTFSSFTFENVQLISDHQLFTMLLYTVSSIALGFLATYMGILVARNI
ncbi:fluoride efflux transporter CrcB [Pedobacter sp. BS3]|uniref:fluoride efflux transporter CrcB n=1 Tax=Pedobacter sp. BS3 TaxID=2567937 RepID=UPI0011EE0058|nr:fluoride efflux transporter CrcB [Pedobacter sp. BS3]TZF81721.1 fluoride efflux transporter CrcB [Pedobacter sp. BS3]